VAKFRAFVLAFALIAVAPNINSAWTAEAQTGDLTAQPPSTAQTAPPAGANQQPTQKPMVVGELNNIRTNTHASFGDSITVCVKGLKNWAEQKVGPDQKPRDSRKLRLFLAGNILPQEEPTLVSLDQEYVNFFLHPNTSDAIERQSWFHILQEARRHDDGSIQISVGSLDDLQPFSSDQFIKLKVYPKYTAAVVVFLGILLAALIFLGYKSSLLRDGSIVGGVKPPLSLGRTQMAWWFYLVIAAYLYLWLITGQVNMLTASVLVLIGISAGTGLSAVFIDQQKQSGQLSQRSDLAIRQAALQARIAQLRAVTPITGSPLDSELQTKTYELATVTATIAALPPLPPPAVAKGLIDILRDGDGISFHRFQIVVWTIVFGAVFVRAVLKDLIMPEFDSTLLGLMGLSSGTYVGFKFPEAPK
jgi:hypothetical protein